MNPYYLNFKFAQRTRKYARWIYFFLSLKTGISQSKGYGCICLDLSFVLLSFWNGDFDDFQNRWLNLKKKKKKKKIKFSKWQKNLSTNKNPTIYCNLGLMHKKDPLYYTCPNAVPSPSLNYYQRYTCICYNVRCKNVNNFTLQHFALILTISTQNVEKYFFTFHVYDQRKVFFFFFFFFFASATHVVFFLFFIYLFFFFFLHFYILRCNIPFCEKKKKKNNISDNTLFEIFMKIIYHFSHFCQVRYMYSNWVIRSENSSLLLNFPDAHDIPRNAWRLPRIIISALMKHAFGVQSISTILNQIKMHLRWPIAIFTF